MGTFMSVEFSATAPSTRRPEAPRPTAFPLSRKFASSPARQTESSSPAFSSSVVSMPPSPPPRTACGFRSRLLPVPGRLWNRIAARPPVLPAPSSSAPQAALRPHPVERWQARRRFALGKLHHQRILRPLHPRWPAPRHHLRDLGCSRLHLRHGDRHLLPYHRPRRYQCRPALMEGRNQSRSHLRIRCHR